MSNIRLRYEILDNLTEYLVEKRSEIRGIKIARAIYQQEYIVSRLRKLISFLSKAALPMAYYSLLTITGDDCSCQHDLIEKVVPFVSDQLNQRQPSIAVDTSSGNYLLCWQSTDSNGASLRAALVGSTGERKSAPIIFESAPTADSFTPTSVQAVYNAAANRYLITWQVTIHSHDGKPVRDELRGRFVGTDGKAIGSTFVITFMNPGLLRNHTLFAVPSRNEYTIVYSNVKTDSKDSIFLSRLDVNGKTIGNPIIANKDKVRQLNEVAMDPKTNTYFVAWNAWKGNASEIDFQMYSSTLAPIGQEHRIAAGDSAIHRVVDNPHRGNFVVFWAESGSLKARAVEPDGSYSTNVASLGIQGQLCDVANDPSTGDFVVTYEGPTQNDPLLLADFNEELTLLQKDFNATCQNPGRLRPGATIVHNPVKNEFLFMWVYASETPRHLDDIYGQRIRLTTLGICPPLL
jgi:hypothetical protein